METFLPLRLTLKNSKCATDLKWTTQKTYHNVQIVIGENTPLINGLVASDNYAIIDHVAICHVKWDI